MDVATYSVWTRKGESYDYQLLRHPQKSMADG